MAKPLLAITMGDPAGVGPEVIVGAWQNPALHALCRAVVLGRPSVFARAAQMLQSTVEVREVTELPAADTSPAILPCLTCGSSAAEQTPPGVIDPRGGQAAYDALKLAAQLALDGAIDALVTAPLNKAALHAAGHDYPGHTEMLADFCGVRDVAMMLYLAPSERVLGPAGLGVAHATLHTALRNVWNELTEQRIVATIRLADGVMRALLPAAGSAAAPRLGVCALNPHAGEEGLFGDEEIRLIAPAVARARALGFDASGPLPADTLFARAAAGEFDAVAAMYHDQGHIALKLLDREQAVNITLGLPIVRTSVAHGTAFDRAWQGTASPRSLLEAVRVAALLVRERRRLTWNP